MVAFRSAVASVAVLLLVPATRKGWSWRTLIAALPYAGTVVLFVLANKLTTSANAIFLQSSAPLFLLLMGPWLLHEKIGRAELLLAARGGAGHGAVLPRLGNGGGHRAGPGPRQRHRGRYGAHLGVHRRGPALAGPPPGRRTPAWPPWRRAT